MRRDSDFFTSGELELIYMATRLRDGLRVEGFLTNAEIDYMVETGTYTAGFLLRRELTGAFFYVLPGDASRCRDLLLSHGYKPYTLV